MKCEGCDKWLGRILNPAQRFSLLQHNLPNRHSIILRINQMHEMKPEPM